jgi:hypothetical protein
LRRPPCKRHGDLAAALGLTQFWRVAADQTKNVGAAARPEGH